MESSGLSLSSSATETSPLSVSRSSFQLRLRGASRSQPDVWGLHTYSEAKENKPVDPVRLQVFFLFFFNLFILLGGQAAGQSQCCSVILCAPGKKKQGRLSRGSGAGHAGYKKKKTHGRGAEIRDERTNGLTGRSGRWGWGWGLCVLFKGRRASGLRAR